MDTFHVSRREFLQASGATGLVLVASVNNVFAADAPYDPLPQIDSPPALLPGTQLSVAGGFYTHGFAILTLSADGTAGVDYFEDVSGAARKQYSETID